VIEATTSNVNGTRGQVSFRLPDRQKALQLPDSEGHRMLGRAVLNLTKVDCDVGGKTVTRSK
jgi:hypothetical protein